MPNAVFYLIAWHLAVVAGAPSSNSKTGTNMLTTAITSKRNCPRNCSNLTIPYPFGIGTSCSLNPFYSLTCNVTFNPPKAFLIPTNMANFSKIPTSIHEIVDISETQIRVRNKAISLCSSTKENETKEIGMLLEPNSPFVFSTTSNMIVVVGCEFSTKYRDHNNKNLVASSSCTIKEDVSSGQCNGNNGCDDTEINGILREFYIYVARHRAKNISRCGNGFVGDKTAFTFMGLPDFDKEKAFKKRIRDTVPLVVDWVIGNQSCEEARKNAETYVCQENSSCKDTNSSIGGYHCQCDHGYEGNPYLPPGCTAITECSYLRQLNGSDCVLKPLVRWILGFGISFITLGIGIGWIYLTIRKQKMIRLKEKLFTKNGGLFLKRQLSLISEGGSQPMTIFTEEELKMATNNFKDDFIAGRGGSGIVYKGFLEEKGFIAIKKAIIMDENQIGQFINELVILSQINHKNVIKLLGCCLEVEVPLLIYEFVPNGALFNHIHDGVHGSWLDWSHCRRIIFEIADALAYLHSAATCPVIHRDIKSANILLDEEYNTKISDFGASRLIPLDQTKFCTAVQGTLGYLDPEYLFTSELTEKSDVYSFGVLVAELLTRKKAVYPVKGSEFRHLATDFVSLMRRGKITLILDPQLVMKAPNKEVMFLVELVGQCLRSKGEDRPTMKYIVSQLDGLVSTVIYQ